MELLPAKNTEAFPPGTRFRLALLGLTVLTAVTFWPVRNFDFVNYDDDRYLVNNPHLAGGFSAQGLRWAFSADLLYDSPHVDYWQPLTLLSRMLDVQLFGLDGPGHHRMNLIFHILNVLLLFSLLSYLAEALWPTGPALYVPGPREVPAGGPVIFASMILTAVTWVTVKGWKRKPILAGGWLWYFITLLPALAADRFEDRFMYLPIAGLLMAGTWGVSDFIERFRYGRVSSAGLAFILFSALVPLTRVQVSYWKDSVTLFTRALEVNPKNFLAYHQLCSAWSDAGDFDKALHPCSEALRLKPDLPGIHYNLGIARAGKGEWGKAISSYQNAFTLHPAYFKARNNLAIALIQAERWDEAIFHLQEAVRLQPDSFEAHNNLATALVHVGRVREAIPHSRRALGLRPGAGFVRQSLRAAEALS